MGLIAALKNKGYSPEKLQRIFEDKQLGTAATGELQKTHRLIERHRGLIRDGLASNYKSVRHWRAIDDAYDAGQQQITTTILRSLDNKDPASPEVLDAAKYWNLELATMVEDCVINGVTCKRLRLPVFFNIFVPLVAAYTKVRWAKLWTDRDTFPLHKYSPASPTLANNMACKIITQEISHETEQMNYRAVERETTLATLLYSYSWVFPQSDYLIHKSLWEDGGKVEEIVLRQGVDLRVVHPSQTFFDRSAPMSTINTDTGVNWMGYWSVTTYSAIKQNKAYWNKDSVEMYSGNDSNTWIQPTLSNIYFNLYPCVLTFPECWRSTENKRERLLYDQSTEDLALIQVSFYDKIIPKDCGLYDCEYPIWHQFIYAGDGTCIHCVPMAYTPGTVTMYDYDTNRARNTSLALELVPFQDHISNLLTQYLLSVKQNLANLVFIDERQVPKETIDKVQNLGQSNYVGLNILPYNRHDNDQMGATATQAVLPVQFVRHNTQELASAINTAISVAERLLGYSPQEVGAAASHEQSATEVAVVSQGTSTRLALTGSFIDDGRTARQKLVYDAWLEYSTKQINTVLTGVQQAQKKALKKMGFKIETLEDSNLVKITGGRHLADVEAFIQFRPPQDRVSDSKVAIAMIQAIQMMMANPVFIEKYGVEFITTRFNEVLEYMGVPGDWRWETDNATGQQPKLEDIVKAMEEYVQGAIDQNNQAVKQELQQTVGQIGQRLNQSDQQVKGLAQETGGVLKQQQQHLAELMATVRGIIDLQAVPPPTAVLPPVPPPAEVIPPGFSPVPVEAVAQV